MGEEENREIHEDAEASEHAQSRLMQTVGEWLKDAGLVNYPWHIGPLFFPDEDAFIINIPLNIIVEPHPCWIGWLRIHNDEVIAHTPVKMLRARADAVIELQKPTLTFNEKVFTEDEIVDILVKTFGGEPKALYAMAHQFGIPPGKLQKAMPAIIIPGNTNLN